MAKLKIQVNKGSVYRFQYSVVQRSYLRLRRSRMSICC